MSRAVEWSRPSLKDLKRLDGTVQGRIVNGVQRFAESGYGDVKALSGDLRGFHRLRIGDYRVILTRQRRVQRAQRTAMFRWSS